MDDEFRSYSILETRRFSEPSLSALISHGSGVGMNGQVLERNSVPTTHLCAQHFS